MPHLVIVRTPDLESATDIGVLCRAVADGRRDCAFACFNLRMGRGRSDAVKQRVGERLANTVRAHFASLLETRAIGLTLQIDEGAEVFDARLGNLHPLFTRT